MCDVSINDVDQRIREDAVKQLETASREHWVNTTFTGLLTEGVASIYGIIEC